MVTKTQKDKRAILAALPAIVVGFSMLGRMNIKAMNSWLGYKRSKAMTHIMELLWKNGKLFQNRFKVIEDMTAIMMKLLSKIYSHWRQK